MNKKIQLINKESLLGFAILICGFNVNAQTTTVFYDNFNRSSVSSGGSPLIEYQIQNSGDATVHIEGKNHLRVIGGSSSTALSNALTGQAFITGNLSDFSAPYNPTLSSNTSDSIVWSFNMRHNLGVNTKLSGFGYGQKGFGVILVADNDDLTKANGYAVVNGGNNTLSYRLIKFSGGLNSNNKLTTLVTGRKLDDARSAMSIRIVYIPRANVWKYYERVDGADMKEIKDPTNTIGTDFCGEKVDKSYTSVPMQKFGFTVKYHLEADSKWYNNFWFDNFSVILAGTVTPAPAKPNL